MSKKSGIKQKINKKNNPSKIYIRFLFAFFFVAVLILVLSHFSTVIGFSKSTRAKKSGINKKLAKNVM